MPSPSQSAIRFLAGPLLWAKAIRDHKKALKRLHGCARGTAEWRRMYELTREPFNRIFDHLMSAFIMGSAYALLAVALIAWVLEGRG